MSYDVLVFDPTIAPRAPRDFETWYNAALEMDEVAFEALDEKLKVFFAHLSQEFPTAEQFNKRQAPRHGILGAFRRLLGIAPPASTLFETAKVTDYSFAPGLIMAHFDLRVAEFALNRVHSAAMFAQVGFFDTCKPVADICFEPS